MCYFHINAFDFLESRDKIVIGVRIHISVLFQFKIILCLLIFFFLLQIHFLWHPLKHLKLLEKHWVCSMRGGNPGWRRLSPALCMISCIAILFSNLMIRMQARYKVQLDPTVEEVKKLCSTCRKYAKTERVLFHYNGHGVPKPTASGEIWLFNKVYIFIYSSFYVNPCYCLILIVFRGAELYPVYTLTY